MPDLGGVTTIYLFTHPAFFLSVSSVLSHSPISVNVDINLFDFHCDLSVWRGRKTAASEASISPIVTKAYYSPADLMY